MRLVVILLLSAASARVGAGERERVTLQSQVSATSPATPRVTLCRSACPCSNCWIAESRNFRIHWCASADEVRALAEGCESLAAALREHWLGGTDKSAWVPRCEIVVHRETSDYVSCLGPGCEQTSGCATIRLDQGRVVVRRIDLRADALDWSSESLPHELTHIVLADHFCTRRIPPWADEGIATLSESPNKLGQRLAELRRVAASGNTYLIRDLLTVQSHPDPTLQAAFYGQSVALVGFLLERGSRKQLLEFVESAQSQGFEAAFREVYGDRSSDELENRLRNYSLTDQAARWARRPVNLARQQLSIVESLPEESGSARALRDMR